MATPAQASAARQRRMVRFEQRLQWFGDKVAANIELGLSQRLRLAAQLLRDKVVINISRPVTKTKGRGGRVRVVPSSRSKPGEFPKLDTGRLMRDIFWRMEDRNTAIVGTTLDYGVVLETRMDRSFLLRTLHEMMPVIQRIMTAQGGFPT